MPPPPPICPDCGKKKKNFVDLYLQVLLGYEVAERRQEVRAVASRLRRLESSLGAKLDAIKAELDIEFVGDPGGGAQQNLAAGASRLVEEFLSEHRGEIEDEEEQRKFLLSQLETNVGKPLQDFLLRSQQGEEGGDADYRSYQAKVEALADKCAELGVVTDRQVFVEKCSVRLTRRSSESVKEAYSLFLKGVQSQEEELLGRARRRQQKAVVVTVFVSVVLAYLAYQGLKYLRGIWRNKLQEAKTVVSKLVNFLRAQLSPLKYPELALIFFVIMASLAHVGLHRGGRVGRSKYLMSRDPGQKESEKNRIRGDNPGYSEVEVEEAYGREYKKSIHREVARAVPRSVYEFNKTYNGLFKLAAPFLQPATVILLKRVVQDMYSDKDKRGIAELRNVLSVRGKEAVRATAPSLAAAGGYWALFREPGRGGGGGLLRGGGDFDLSGHALLMQLNAIATVKLRPKDGFEHAVVLIWLVCCLIQATTTIVFYHTIPEYLSGLILAYAIVGLGDKAGSLDLSFIPASFDYS
jgi:hypothetical protein